MAVLQILRWPDPRLATPCRPVGRITDEIRTLAADMLETMYAAPGRGLAAPQVGRLIRLFVMDTGWREGTPCPRVLIDPVIDWRSDETATHAEGCLSIPGILTEVTRPTGIRLRWTDPEGRPQTAELAGFEATFAQHEIDHLDGIVTLDRLSPAARATAEAEYRG